MSTTTAASAATTHTSRRLLASVVSPVLFLVVSALQMPFNTGFDLTKHAFSYLSIGETGPLQQVNFIVMGVLNVVAATALPGVITGRLGVAAGVLLAIDGAGQIVAGLFTLDPSFGFPPGAPAGMPQTITLHGNLHGLGFTLSMVSWVALFIVLAIRHVRAGERGWAAASVVAAIALLGTAACLGTAFGTELLYAVLSATWLFTASTMQHLRPPTGRAAVTELTPAE